MEEFPVITAFLSHHKSHSPWKAQLLTVLRNHHPIEASDYNCVLINYDRVEAGEEFFLQCGRADLVKGLPLNGPQVSD